MAQDYDLSSLLDNAEELPEPTETADYVTSKTIPVGNYISTQRTVTGKKLPTGHYSFTIIFSGGITDEKSGKVFAEKYPLKKWISTTPFTQKDFTTGEELQGQTSSVATYLRKCGFNPKGMGILDILEAMKETQIVPVKVFIGRTDKRNLNKDTGVWEGGELKTRDFETGRDADNLPIYAETVTREGKVFYAAPTVTSFSKI